MDAGHGGGAGADLFFYLPRTISPPAASFPYNGRILASAFILSE
jgi:hypothetical protein